VDLLNLDGRFSADPRIEFFHGRGDGTFDNPINLPSITDVWAGRLADIDGDGRLDIISNATGTASRNEVAVFLAAEPPNWLGFPVRSVVGIHSGRPLPVDLDNDGSLDLVIARDNSVVDAILVARGAGDGSFSVLAEYPIPNPSDMVAADFDGDGHTDVAVNSVADSMMYVYIGIGDGSLAPPTAYTLRPFERSIAAADVNRDSWVDIVSFNTEAVARLNDGAGRFVEGGIYTTGITSVFNACALDFNSDGIPDFACLGSDRVGIGNVSALSLLLSDGLGGYSAPFKGLVAQDTGSLSIADIDADGAVDFAFGSATGPDVPILLGDGAGRVGPLARRIPVTRDIYHLSRAADFDGDGLFDVIGATNSPGAFLFRGTPDGAVAFDSVVSDSLLVRDMAVADFNGDRMLDVALAEDVLALFLGDGTGRFVQGPTFPQPGPITAMDHGDIDEDGILDVVMTSVTFSETRIYLADGAGSFLNPPIRMPGTQAAQVIAQDVDLDGHLDLALGGAGTQMVRFGNGTGAFPASVSVPNATAATTDMTVSDFDGDGLLDVAFLGEEGIAPGSRGRISIAKNSAGGRSFGFVESHPVGGYPFCIEPFDADGDGIVDLASSNANSFSVTVLRGRGDATFERPSCSFGCGARPWPHGIAIADFDRDGRPDLLVATPWSKDLSLLYNRTQRYPSLATRALQGGVNAGRGTLADTLLVNGSPGDAATRTIVLSPSTPFEVRMIPPPTRSRRPQSAFALYGSSRVPSDDKVITLPFGAGLTAFPIPATGGRPGRIWNNFGGRVRLLGAPDAPSTPAPSTVLSLGGGIGFSARFTLQGIIRDDGAAASRFPASPTNGVFVIVRE